MPRPPRRRCARRRRARARASRARAAGAAGGRRRGRRARGRPAASSSSPSSAASRDQPARQVARLDVALLGDLAAGRLDRLAQRGGDLVAALLAAEERDGQASRRRCSAWPRRRRRDLGVLPALDAVGDDEAAAERRRSSRDSARGDRVGRAGVALEQLDAARARSRARPSRAGASRRSAMRPWSSPWMR